ncbi:unnamed protein product [Ilex paraguariensis]|uniref:F-box domain-containing protein n=1 Tax=Ilex paraguariensis TaxID=185542 RepID=A0ABC8UEQ5_9AQUA
MQNWGGEPRIEEVVAGNQKSEDKEEGGMTLNLPGLCVCRLTETIKHDRRAAIEENNEKEKQQTWSDLPVELLELIISRLTLMENIRASAACKRWLSVAISVRVVNKPPWIMFFPKFGDLFEFYDPSQRKTYSLALPELLGSRVCYTKDGWLLLYKPRTQRMLFFSPYTRELIKLPRFELTHQIVAFSSGPTSPGCIVFTVKHISPTVVAISTCHPGATEWTTINYHNRLPFVSSIWNKLVFCNGLFYCLSLTGWLGVYNPQDSTWNIHPKIYKLDQINKVWVEMKTLGGLTLFASFLSSQARTDLLGMKRNSVYFSKFRFYGKRCISYSLDDCRYYPRKQCYDWGEQNPFESVWIEPPEDLSVFV